jgi:hypothetical protein
LEEGSQGNKKNVEMIECQRYNEKENVRQNCKEEEIKGGIAKRGNNKNLIELLRVEEKGMEDMITERRMLLSQLESIRSQYSR